MVSQGPEGEFDWDGLKRRLNVMSGKERALWAGETLKRLDAKVSDPGLSEEERQKLEEGLREVRALLAGLARSPWLPRGTLRKAMMAVCLVFGVLNVLQGNLWYLVLIALCVVFSPRILEEIVGLLGSLRR